MISKLLILTLSILSISLNAAARDCAASARHDQMRDKLGSKCKHSDNRLRCLDVIKVTDGDTVALNIPKVHPYFGKQTSVRLYGLDTPEKRPPTVKCLPLPEEHTALDKKDFQNCLAAKRLRKCELQASNEATQLLKNAICNDSDRVDIELLKDSKGELRREKFGRVLGKVHVLDYNGNPRSKPRSTDVQKLLLRKGLAFRYLGSKKLTRDWCKKTIVKKKELQIQYVQSNYCSGRKCTEKTRMTRCMRQDTFARRIQCYQDRVQQSMSTWLRSCNSKSGTERRLCYRKKSEGYLQYCTMFSALTDTRSCRGELSATIENYCNGLKKSAAKDCLASI